MSEQIFKSKKERYEKYEIKQDDIVFECDGSYWTNHGDPGYSMQAEELGYVVFAAFDMLQKLFKGPKVQNWLDTTEMKYFTYMGLNEDGSVYIVQEATHELCDNCATGPCHPLYEPQTREMTLPVKLRFKFDIELVGEESNV